MLRLTTFTMYVYMNIYIHTNANEHICVYANIYICVFIYIDTYKHTIDGGIHIRFSDVAIAATFETIAE